MLSKHNKVIITYICNELIWQKNYITLIIMSYFILSHIDQIYTNILSSLLS